MAEAVLMPKTGITVQSCIIGEWKKNIGDPVGENEILFTYETDKAVFECPSTATGVLLEVYYSAGDEVPCLETVCAVGLAGDDCSSVRPKGRSVEAAGQIPVKEPFPERAAMEAVSADRTEPLASPRAKRLAEKCGADWRRAIPTGSRGYIIERDVRALLSAKETEDRSEVCAPSPDSEQAEYTDSRLSGIRRTIARTMTESLHTSAQLTVNFAFDATEIQRYRASLKALGGKYSSVTIGDMILFAVSRTLPHFPDLNAHIPDDEHIRRFSAVHLAVAVDTPRGLMVPVIRNAEKKSLLEISAEVKALSAEARSGSVSPDKLRGGSFTVSNLGSFGVRSFTPVLNPPQTGILGVCVITDAVRMGRSGMELYPEMNLSLTFDHRAVDGAPAARFMQELCRRLEHFTAMLLE